MLSSLVSLSAAVFVGTCIGQAFASGEFFMLIDSSFIFNTFALYLDQCNGDDYGVAGNFDFYVFSQSWSAEFCKQKESYPGCEDPTPEMKANLTIHGEVFQVQIVIDVMY
jgi:ribonuclease I